VTDQHLHHGFHQRENEKLMEGGCLAQVCNAFFRLLDHEIGAAVQPAELGPFFVTIFSILREAKT